MPRLARVLTVIAVLAAPALAQDVPVEKYTLDNGMTVILRQDRSLPVATVNLWYRVGAKDEPPGRSGFAHLYEHLMFMGTERVPGGNFDTIMEAGGGANNASTSLDRTNYFSSGPSSLLPTLLWLDADRLEDMARMMDQSKLDKQREVVRNELRQVIENRPYGKAEEFVYRLMYPKGHPYHESVAGTHEDLESASVWNVKDFFATYYVPNNASLVVAGDFDPAAIKPMIARLFGTLRRGGDVPRKTVEPARVDRVIRTTMMDKVQLPMVKMVWHSPAMYAEGDAEMQLVGALLSEGKNSRLYTRLVMSDQTAVEVSARQDGAGLGSLFVIDVLAKPQADLGAIEKAVDEELARLAGQPIGAEELDQRKATVELAKLSDLQSVDAVADKLNEYEYIWGEPNSFKRDLDRYRGATPVRIQWWAKKTLDPGARAVIRVMPEQPERVASGRDERPKDFPPAAFTPAPPQTFMLSSGAPVMLWRKPELPLVAATWVFDGRGAFDAPARAGLAGLAVGMTEEGAGTLDAGAFAGALQSLGATYHVGADHESATAGITVLKRNFEKAAALMADALRRPRNAAEDWSRVKSLHLDALRQVDDEPGQVAARVGLRSLFGDQNIYGWPSDGTIKTIEPLTLDDVKAAQRAVLRPDRATLLIAGDITPEEARPILERAFGDWKASGEPARAGASLATPAAPTGMRVLIVDRPEAVQTVVRFMMPAPGYADQRRIPLRLMNTVFGGSFTSRLNQNLRETHGYTYGARSRVVLNPSSSYFVASSDVQAEVTGKALKEFLAEFARLREGDLSDDEATKARETVRTDTVQSFQSLDGLLGVAADLLLHKAPFGSLAQDLSQVAKASASDLNAAAKSVVNLEGTILVLVGDKRLILEQIKDLNLPTPVEVSTEGAPMREGAAVGENR